LEEHIDGGSGFFHNTDIIPGHENAPVLLLEVGGRYCDMMTESRNNGAIRDVQS
jgi:hypothetical protein